MRYLIATLGVVVMAACEPDPGTADYSSHVGVVPDCPFEDGVSVPSPDPFEPGDQRLRFGIFHDGEFTEEVVPDGLIRNFFIFDTAGDGTGAETVALIDECDRVEGEISISVNPTGQIFWGAGFVWYQPEDLSAWTHMVISLKSEPGATFESLSLTMQAGAEGPVDFTVAAGAYGYAADGAWHNLTIPLEDFGADLVNVWSPLILGGPAGNPRDALFIDNFYYTKLPEAP